MIFGVDSNILVHFFLEESELHGATRQFLSQTVLTNGNQLGISESTLLEFLHVVTDPKRFQRPLSMRQALHASQELLYSKDCVLFGAHRTILLRTLELLELYRLGRKRILDTFLAATLEVAGIKKMITCNKKDFENFPFLEVLTLAS